MTAPRRPGVGTPTHPARPGATAPPVDALVGRAVELAFDSLNRIEREATRVARWFRANARREAHQGLTDLVNMTQSMASLATAAASAIGIDFDDFCATRGLPAESTTTALLNELLRHQQTDNTHALATVLERRLAETLDVWRRVFVALAGGPTDPSGQAA